MSIEAAKVIHWNLLKDRIRIRASSFKPLK